MPLLARMASSSSGASREASAPPPVAGGAPRNATGAPTDTTHLDKLCEKALTADSSGRYALAAAFYRYTAEEALRLHGETFVCTFLTLERAGSLAFQSQLEGVTEDEKATLRAEAWALASSCMPLLVRRMDDNTMLPGRGTAVELAFFKRFTATRDTTLGVPSLSARNLQLVGLSLGYVIALSAATLLLHMLGVRRDGDAQSFVLRVVDWMLPAARAWQNTLLKMIFILYPQFNMYFLVRYPTTQRLWPLSDRNGPLRR